MARSVTLQFSVTVTHILSLVSMKQLKLKVALLWNTSSRAWFQPLLPPRSLLLAPGVFKLSCSTSFTLFLRLVSVYWPFQLYFIPKLSPQYLCFQLPSYSLFLPNRPFSCLCLQHSSSFYIVLLALCGHLQTQRVCRALHPVSWEDGILVAEVPRGVQHASSARTSPWRVVGLARPNQSTGRANP